MVSVFGCVYGVDGYDVVDDADVTSVDGVVVGGGGCGVVVVRVGVGGDVGSRGGVGAFNMYGRVMVGVMYADGMGDNVDDVVIASGIGVEWRLCVAGGCGVGSGDGVVGGGAGLGVSAGMGGDDTCVSVFRCCWH